MGTINIVIKRAGAQKIIQYMLSGSERVSLSSIFTFTFVPFHLATWYPWYSKTLASAFNHLIYQIHQGKNNNNKEN